MKKILISILTILGVGLSFCSAEDINFTIESPLTVYDSQFNLLVSNVNLFRSYTSTYTIDMQTNRYINFGFTGFSNSLYLNNICFKTSKDYSSFLFYINGVSYPFTTSGDLYCVVLSSPVDLSLYNYYFTGRFAGGDIDYRFSLYDLSFSYYNNFTESVNGRNYYKNLYIPLGYNNSYIFIDYNSLNTCNYCQNKSDLPIFYSISLTVPTNPKFKVNYGNTFYEYELEDNLSIYLKSPVIQSGNTFTYNGSTGINLFFNGGSQFYGKDKLYLDGYYRFSKNVFYPICN